MALTRSYRRWLIVVMSIAIILTVATVEMLVVGYVPHHMHGPANERVFTLLFGVGDGMLVALALAIVMDLRGGS